MRARIKRNKKIGVRARINGNKRIGVRARIIRHLESYVGNKRIGGKEQPCQKEEKSSLVSPLSYRIQDTGYRNTGYRNRGCRSQVTAHR